MDRADYTMVSFSYDSWTEEDSTSLTIAFGGKNPVNQEPNSNPKSPNFPLFSKRSKDKNRLTGISNGSFDLKWVENGAFLSRSPVSKSSICDDDP